MGDLRFQIKVTATGEVRDADGNLISPATAESVEEVTESELVERGFTIPHRINKEKN